MAVISLPTPTARRAAPAGDYSALENALRRAVRGQVRFDAGSRATYSTDASNYRQVPIGVVCPADVDDAVEAVRICREHDVPVLSRGGGTSLGGECCNVAVVLDWTKYVHGVEFVDAGARTAIILPGTVLDDANAELAHHGLVIGPKPATHSHCTIGGMIGNNSCGATAQWSGTTAQNVARLEVLTCGGITGWQQVAGLAGAHNLQISGHCAPALHLDAAIATANLRRLEYFHDHVRIETLFFDDVTTPGPDGVLRPDLSARGTG